MDEVRDKVRYKVGNSRIHFLMIEDPEIIPGNIYFLRIEDPEVIPGNILSQDRGS